VSIYFLFFALQEELKEAQRIAEEEEARLQELERQVHVAL
jgi:hypothetical protein